MSIIYQKQSIWTEMFGDRLLSFAWVRVEEPPFVYAHRSYRMIASQLNKIA